MEREYPWFLETYDSSPENIMRSDAVRARICHPPCSAFFAHYIQPSLHVLSIQPTTAKQRQLVFLAHGIPRAERDCRRA